MPSLPHLVLLCHPFHILSSSNNPVSNQILCYLDIIILRLLEHRQARQLRNVNMRKTHGGVGTSRNTPPSLTHLSLHCSHVMNAIPLHTCSVTYRTPFCYTPVLSCNGLHSVTHLFCHVKDAILLHTCYVT